MHDLKLIVNDPDLFKKNLKKRFMDVNIVDEIMNLDKKRREFIQEVEGRRAEVKKLSREIGQLKKNGQDAKKEMTKVPKDGILEVWCCSPRYRQDWG